MVKQSERLGEVGTPRAKEGVRLTQEAWAPGSRRLRPWEEEGPGVLAADRPTVEQLSRPVTPHANPVITRSGVPLQTPGSVRFLQSHRIWPGLSLSWPGGWGPLEGVSPLSPALPRGEGVRAGPHLPRPAKAMLLDSASSL